MEWTHTCYDVTLCSPCWFEEFVYILLKNTVPTGQETYRVSLKKSIELMFVRETLAVYLDSNNEHAGNNTGSINFEVNGIHSNQYEQLRQPNTTINLSWVYNPFSSPHTSLSPYTCYVASIRSKYYLRHHVLVGFFNKYKQRAILNLLKVSDYYSYRHV